MNVSKRRATMIGGALGVAVALAVLAAISGEFLWPIALSAVIAGVYYLART